MNKLKKTALGVVVAGLAFGFSAFSTMKNSKVLVYYKVDYSYAAADDPRGYAYYSGDRCEPGGNVCTAQWDIGFHFMPNEGDWLPSTGVYFQTGSVLDGHFE